MKTFANIVIGGALFLLFIGVASHNGGLYFIGGMVLLLIGGLLKVGAEADS